MTRFALPAGALRVAMVVVLIGATPLATGAAGYYLGRSQVPPVEPTSAFPIFIPNGQESRSVPWVGGRSLSCPFPIAPGVTATVTVFFGVGGEPRCPSVP